jgi:hypothetical protein
MRTKMIGCKLASHGKVYIVVFAVSLCTNPTQDAALASECSAAFAAARDALLLAGNARLHAQLSAHPVMAGLAQPVPVAACGLLGGTYNGTLLHLALLIDNAASALHAPVLHAPAGHEAGNAEGGAAARASPESAAPAGLPEDEGLALVQKEGAPSSLMGGLVAGALKVLLGPDAAAAAAQTPLLQVQLLRLVAQGQGQQGQGGGPAQGVLQQAAFLAAEAGAGHFAGCCNPSCCNLEKMSDSGLDLKPRGAR